ncbi:hypothetical protein HNY73_017752 [Argiope bruennichi]|uniref:CCHC-type domain-containing protein n=1 Tax=Argiope bruennichi TaxID=94029 RepID=A0A8T0EC20_ARGBR|nr:hypothetical protein HNY73_017752 [Argiope bruennichi]
MVLTRSQAKMAESENNKFQEIFAFMKELKQSLEENQAAQKKMFEENQAAQKKMFEENQAAQKKMFEENRATQEKTLEKIEEMKSGQEELKKDIVSVKEEFSNIIQEKMNATEDKVASFENKVREDIGKEFEQKFGKEIESLKKQISHEHEESKVIFTPSLATIKLSTFDGKTSWQVYKTQFTMVAEANGWNPQAKAFHLATSLRGDAADILETLTEEQRHDFQALSSALELRFGEKCTKEYSRLQLKFRYQKAGESLQELAADIQRLSHLAFSDCPVETRQDLALQHFVDSVRDPETRKALRLADVKDIGSALVFAHKIEAAQQGTRKDRHPIRAVSAANLDSDFVKQIDYLRRGIRRLKECKDGRSTEIRCWTCGTAGHVRRNCRVSRSGGNNFPPHQGN